MQFEFEGSRYRIVFSYDKDRNWASHRDHDIAFLNRMVAHKTKTLCKGQPILYCTTCKLQLSHLPKSQKRLARCTLFVHHQGAWESTANGQGRVNLKAGDQFSHKGGREAALTAMLENFTRARIGNVWHDAIGETFVKHPEVITKAFRAVAWAAYNNRKQAGPFRKEAGT